MRALAEAVASKPAPTMHDVDEFEDDGGDDQHFFDTCLEEIDRYRRIDEWIPSYHNVLSTTALDCKRMLAKAGIVDTTAADFLEYTQDGTSEYLRLNAFANLMDLGMAKNNAMLRWFLFVLSTDPSPFVRQQMLLIFGRTLGAIAIGESSEAEEGKAAQQDGLIIEQEGSTEGRKADLARKQTIVGALNALKDELSANGVLKQEMWKALKSPSLSLQHMGELLDICELLYSPETEMVVVLKYPRYWQCKKTGKGKVFFSRSNRIRTTPMPKRQVLPPIAVSTHPPIKRENSTPMPPPIPRLSFKPLKKPTVQRTASTSSMDSVPQSPAAGGEGEAPKPLKLKLNFGKLKGAGGAGSP